MGTLLDSECVCVCIVTSVVMVGGPYARQRVELVLEGAGPMTWSQQMSKHLLNPVFGCKLP